MTNVITKPFSIHYGSRDAGMMKLRGISTASCIDNTRLTFEWHPNPVHITISPDALGSSQSKFPHSFLLMSAWSAHNLGLMVHFSYWLALAKSNMSFICMGAGLDEGANILSTVWLSLDLISWLIIVSGMLLLLLSESCWMLSIFCKWKMPHEHGCFQWGLKVYHYSIDRSHWVQSEARGHWQQESKVDPKSLLSIVAVANCSKQFTHV